MSFEVVAYQYLKACDVRVDQENLKERLRSHPDYPSLAALTDVFDDWRLEYSALQLEHSDLAQMEYPFIAHVITAQGREDFRVIKDRAQVDQEGDQFLKSWTGIVVWVAPKSKIDNHEHEEQYADNRNNTLLKWLIGSTGTIALALLLARQFDLTLLVFALLTIAGCLFSAAIIGYVLGIDNSIARNLCDVTEIGCVKIIHSPFSKVLPGVHLSDVALAYYLGLFVSVAFLGTLSPAAYFQTIAIPVSLSMLVSITSLVYQAIKGEWCKLCLGLSAVIWLQFALLGFYLDWQVSAIVFDWNALIFFLFSFVIGSAWWLVRPYIERSRLVSEQRIKLRKWRQDPRWFQAILPLHKAIDQTIWDREIIYGNPEGVLQMTLATGPYCDPCARAHQEANELLARYPDDIGIKIRFVMKPTNKKDVTAALAILSAYEQQVWGNEQERKQKASGTIIHDWFGQQDLAWFRSKYPSAEPASAETRQLLEQHIRWANQFQIEQTPGFFVNGHEMPNPHTLTDLAAFLDSYIENLKTPLPLFHLSGQNPPS